MSLKLLICSFHDRRRKQNQNQILQPSSYNQVKLNNNEPFAPLALSLFTSFLFVSTGLEDVWSRAPKGLGPPRAEKGQVVT